MRHHHDLVNVADGDVVLDQLDIPDYIALPNPVDPLVDLCVVMVTFLPSLHHKVQLQGEHAQYR